LSIGSYCLYFWKSIYDIKGGGSLGATIFVLLGLIGILFVLAFLLIILGLVLAISFKIKSKRSKIRKKIYTILPAVFLSIGIVILIFPLTITFFIRASNSYSYSGYVKTGVNAFYDYDNVYSNDYQGSFTLNNINYVGADLHPLDNIKKLNPIANVKNRGNALNSFLLFVFNKNNNDTLYVVQNNSGYDILYATNSGNLFCKKTDSGEITTFYNNMSNYNWKICDGIYDSNSKFHNIVLNTDMFNKLEDFSNKSFDNKRINISSAFIEKTIFGASNDSLNFRTFGLLKYKNKIYYVVYNNHDENDKITNVTAIPLEDEISNYFLTIF
jgi:hypothetical protein